MNSNIDYWHIYCHFQQSTRSRHLILAISFDMFSIYVICVCTKAILFTICVLMFLLLLRFAIESIIYATQVCLDTNTPSRYTRYLSV